MVSMSHVHKTSSRLLMLEKKYFLVACLQRSNDVPTTILKFRFAIKFHLLSRLANFTVFSFLREILLPLILTDH